MLEHAPHKHMHTPGRLGRKLGAPHKTCTHLARGAEIGVRIRCTVLKECRCTETSYGQPGSCHCSLGVSKAGRGSPPAAACSRAAALVFTKEWAASGGSQKGAAHFMMGNRAEGCLLAGLRTSVWQPQFRTPSTHKAAVRQGKYAGSCYCK